jgi:hypothetical protein
MVFSESPAGLPSNNVGQLTIDGSGNRWIGTDKGVAVFDGSTGWTRHLSGEIVQTLAAQGTSVYAGTVINGIYSGPAATWTNYKTGNSGLLNNFVSAIAIDAGGNKWIASRFGGLNVFKEGGKIQNPRPGQAAAAPTLLRSAQWIAGRRSFVFRYRSPNQLPVTLQVFDARGGVLASADGVASKTGEGELELPASRTAGGAYVYRLRSGALQAAGTMSVQR